jgi:DNA-binding transcriptional LysR family regulator
MDATQRVRAMLSFVQAADRGSFAAAARTLGITAAAVGKNVAGLEAALGVRLMNRSTRSLQLTREGEVFLQGAREAIDALDAAIDGVAAQRAQATGRVRIACSHGFGRHFLLPVLPGLVQAYPGLRPEVEFEDRRVDLVRDGFDLGLRGGDPHDSSLVSRTVCQLHLVLVAAPAYLAAHGQPKSVDDLSAHRLIAVRFLNGNALPWRFRNPGGAPREWLPESAVLVLSDPESTVDAALQGMGIAQCGLHHAWEHLQTGALQVVLPRHHDPGSRLVTLQYPHRALVAPRVRVTVDYLLAEFAKVEALTLTPAQLRSVGI